jgi:hypothetical protein
LISLVERALRRAFSGVPRAPAPPPAGQTRTKFSFHRAERANPKFAPTKTVDAEDPCSAGSNPLTWPRERLSSVHSSARFIQSAERGTVKKLGRRASWRTMAPSPCPMRLGRSLAFPASAGLNFFTAPEARGDAGEAGSPLLCIIWVSTLPIFSHVPGRHSVHLWKSCGRFWD